MVVFQSNPDKPFLSFLFLSLFQKTTFGVKWCSSLWANFSHRRQCRSTQNKSVFLDAIPLNTYLARSAKVAERAIYLFSIFLNLCSLPVKSRTFHILNVVLQRLFHQTYAPFQSVFTVIICLQWGAYDVHIVQLMPLLRATLLFLVFLASPGFLFTQFVTE